ncbi:hypothetical protein [Amycolatopsis thermophila]|uniref:Uncharacterized protein n=1 Tax=Amycolatopsis thermophila TaxID=206084 RepID=A0ABU0ERR0_9PSEU|nr:hypothetical protein [Amycolatopsis thermophila]MDQ0377969.1 hypothetical protein [Amycolatopsis thermophila]
MGGLMAFSPIDQSVINGIFIPRSGFGQKVKDNFDDHEARLQTLESGGSEDSHTARYIQNSPQTNLAGGSTNAMVWDFAQEETEDLVLNSAKTVWTVKRAGWWRATANTRVQTGTFTGEAEVFLVIGAVAGSNSIRYADNNGRTTVNGAVVKVNCSVERRFDVNDTIAINMTGGNAGTHQTQPVSEAIFASFSWLRA